MECSRCRGLMVRDHVVALLDTEIHGEVWRCVCCGHILDPVIMANRRRMWSNLLDIRTPARLSNARQLKAKSRRSCSVWPRKGSTAVRVSQRTGPPYSGEVRGPQC